MGHFQIPQPLLLSVTISPVSISIDPPHCQNKRAKMKRDKIQKDDEQATATRNNQSSADHGYNAYNSMGL